MSSYRITTLNTLIVLLSITWLAYTEINTPKKIKIKNNIQRKDVGKTKFFMRHYPEKFKIYVNGKTLNTNEIKDILITNQQFKVQYSYTWNAPWGKISGTKQVSYKINNTDAKMIELNFSSWDDVYRIKASGATPIEVTVIESSGNRKKTKKRKQKRHVNTQFKKPLLSVSSTYPQKNLL
ncbi:MAG: hypothetical protein R3321_15560, partial [Nitrososphaeraceae archaeon]|nr:hypothetical protein [Nitrososphaeraceae archaeon]